MRKPKKIPKSTAPNTEKTHITDQNLILTTDQAKLPRTTTSKKSAPLLSFRSCSSNSKIHA